MLDNWGIRGIINHIRKIQPSRDVLLLIFSNKYHPNPNACMFICMNYSLLLVWYWSHDCFCRVLYRFVIRFGLYVREGYIFLQGVSVITPTLELLLYWYLILMGCWRGIIWCLVLQWRPSPIVQKDVVPHLQNHKVREKYTTDQSYAPFSPTSETPSYLEAHISSFLLYDFTNIFARC